MSTPLTFQLAVRGGRQIETAYTKLVVIAGSVARTLALHKTPSGAWAVSDPVSGAAVVSKLIGTHKGVPCSTRGATIREARAAALAAVDRLIERVGSEHFNKTLDNPKPF